MDTFNLEPIGVIHTPYGQKFAVPRQPGLAAAVACEIELLPPYCDPQACIGLEGFSHIHVIFIFDKVEVDKFRPMIRPPRLGGNQKVGLFASRSPFRPSRLGLSVLKLEKVENRNGKTVLHVLGADMVDGTPILDIKPYIPFVDALPDAVGGFALEPPKLKQVAFTSEADALITKLKLDKTSLIDILAQDPRPAYKGTEDDKPYFALLMGYNIKFTVSGEIVTVLDVLPAETAMQQ